MKNETKLLLDNALRSGKYSTGDLQNNLNNFESLILQGKDLLDDLCEYYDLVLNKLEEQVEFIYTLFINKQNN